MTDDERVAVTEQALRQAVCQVATTFITGDGRVSEDIAGELLGFSCSTLRSWRAAGTGPAVHRISGRVTYSLRDLAEFIVGSREGGQ
jgi:hypothetical protein